MIRGTLGVSGAEAALVALCHRDEPVRRAREVSPEFASAEFQFELAALAQRHGLFGLMLYVLERGGVFAELPAAVAADYRSSLRLLRRQAALWDLERDFVLGLLAERGIPTVLLKGAALRLLAYTDPVQRSFGDVDILVPESATDAAVTALGESGYRGHPEHLAKLYREHHHHLILRKELGFIVEVHWALEPVRSPFRLDPEAFRRSARQVETPGKVKAWIPSPEHCVLHLATQNLEDGFSRLGRLVDIDRIIAASGPEAAFDWKRMAADALAMRVNTVVGLSLRLAELLFGTPVPATLLDSLELGGVVRANLALLDPIGLVLEQRANRRASLHQLLVLWSVADRPTRVAVLRAMRAGKQDWFAHLMPVEAGGSRRRSPTVATLKLGLYQLWVYLSAVRARPRARKFWRLRAAG